jgi:hypothetical protein
MINLLSSLNFDNVQFSGDKPTKGTRPGRSTKIEKTHPQDERNGQLLRMVQKFLNRTAQWYVIFFYLLECAVVNHGCAWLDLFSGLDNVELAGSCAVIVRHHDAFLYLTRHTSQARISQKLQRKAQTEIHPSLSSTASQRIGSTADKAPDGAVLDVSKPMM